MHFFTLGNWYTTVFTSFEGQKAEGQALLLHPPPARGKRGLSPAPRQSLESAGEAAYKGLFPAMENVAFPQPLIPLFLFSSLSHVPLQKVMQSCFVTCCYHRRWCKTARFSPTVRSFSQAQWKPEMSSSQKGGVRTLF